MQSLIQIYNLALAQLGGEQIPQNISSLERDTVGAICQNIFPHVLDTVLESHEWGFAKKRIALALLHEQENSNTTSMIRYALPSDCIRPIEVLLPKRDDVPVCKGSRYIEYTIEGNAFLCNVEQAVLLYVSKITDPSLFPPSFIEVLKWKMASELATARNNDKQQKQYCEQKYEYELGRVCALDRSKNRKNPYISAWQMARKG